MDPQVELTKTKVFFRRNSVFDLSRRCVADVHRDWFLFPSRAPQQWGLLESWHNTSEQRLRTVYFCAGNGDHDGSVFFRLERAKCRQLEKFLFRREIWWKQMKTFHATVLRLAGAYWNSAWLVTWTRSAENSILCWLDSPIAIMTSNKWKCD